MRAAITYRREIVLALLERCGTAAVLAVGSGGLALGFILWRSVAAYTAKFVAHLALVPSLVTGVLVAFALWIVVAAVSHKRWKIDLIAILRASAPAYTGLLASPALALTIWRDRGVAPEFVAGALFAIGSILAIAKYDAATRIVTRTYALAKVPVVVIVALSAAFLPTHGAHHPIFSHAPMLDAFARWDGVHYLEIARNGYRGTDVAFFPLYPVLIRIFGVLLRSDLVAAIAISNVAGLVAAYFLYRLADAQYDAATATRVVLYSALFPTAFFFSSAYSESLFLALTLAMFWSLRENRYLSAGFLGGLATLTRAEGVLLLVCYIVEILAPERELWVAITTSARVRRHLAIGAAMIPAGLLAFMALLWILDGDPLAFTHVQAHWNRHLAFPWTTLWRSFHLVVASNDPPTIAMQGIELAFTTFLITTAIVGIRRMRPSYSAYAVMSIVVPLASSSLMSTPRFALVVFPAFFVLGIWGKHDNMHTLILAWMLPLLGLFTALYANWYWVA